MKTIMSLEFPPHVALHPQPYLLYWILDSMYYLPRLWRERKIVLLSDFVNRSCYSFSHS